MARQEKQKHKLLALARIFETETDENHRLTVPQLAQILLRRELGALGEPADDGDEDGVAEEGDIKILVLHPLEDVLGEEGHDGGDGLAEVLPEGVLAGDLQGAPIEVLFPVEIVTQVGQQGPAAAVVPRTEGLEKFGVEDPVHQVVLVPEMIVKTLPAHVADLADVTHADLGKGLCAHQVLQGLGQSPFRDVGIRHAITSRRGQPRVGRVGAEASLPPLSSNYSSLVDFFQGSAQARVTSLIHTLDRNRRTPAPNLAICSMVMPT